MEQIGTQTTNRVGNANDVMSSVEVHGGEAAEVLHRILGGRCGFDPEQIKPFMEALADYLGETNEGLVVAEELLTSENADDVRARGERNTSEGEMLATTVKSKSVISYVLGDDAVREYGLSGEIPRTAKPLALFVRNVITLMRKNPREVHDDLVEEFKTETVANRLEEGLSRLTTANQNLKRESRETELALEKRDAQVETWSTAYRGVSKTLEGLYRLAGHPELADRIKETVRKSAGKEGPEATSAEPPAEEVTEAPPEGTGTTEEGGE